ncbi:MAG: radical SAM protein [Nitrospirae bacterium]|nr:radical SAM protein [Nitrospirota bacterium]MBI3352074.1 radical SAM protein [Nitrospirota bacterium]
MKINEIFYSIQGESTFAGLPCTLIRTTGCHLRCAWCDTAYAFYEGKELSLEEIIQQVESIRCRLVEITGGEPLLQEDSLVLMARLLDKGFKVLLETSGGVDVGAVDSRVKIIMDVKCPGSGMSDRMIWKNLNRLKETDEIKFVIANRQDYDWAKETLEAYQPSQEILFSPVFGEQDPQSLAEWVLKDRLPVRFQLQMHKHIWSPQARGV